MKLLTISNKQFSTALQNLMQLKGVPPKTMFAVRGLAKIIAEESTKFEELRKQIIEEFAERDANNNIVRLNQTSIKIKQNLVSEMDKKLRELADIDIKIPEIKFSDLGENPSLTSEDLYHLEFIVE